MNKNVRVFNLVLSALFASLIFVVTAYFPRIPTARGYIHIGDAVIYLAASMLPAPYAAAAAGLGGFLADALTGYAMWAPYTLVVKIALTLPFTSKSEKIIPARNVAAALAAFPITIGGYYAAAWIMTGNAAAPLAEIPANAVQAAGSMALYAAAAVFMEKTRLKARLGAAR
jgi:uncharacterized repeat protein (TIGR04002 family)